MSTAAMFRLPNRRAVPPPARAHERAPTDVQPSTAAAQAARLHAEVVARLRPSCGGLSPDAFEALVRQVVAFRTRWGPAPAHRGGAR